ncbi:uncharacterized protein KQ657_000593 [Scheffersomyces spartinae]|uniref:Major facilitator superfamily (MFS) profile domain-containing protein n=1 Tax=Scheffersomyces spartinae TaxID=45513 RepID=A0A9P7V8T1_9ASCO|nr:uncharacterized protein KQ657_000593 [Scheffersomyces spartinae]KAG7193525.1 hypothetical protein KQ657_000593 [Scheffersomyces spartinae]
MSRDLPKSIPDFFWGWTAKIPSEITFNKSKEQLESADLIIHEEDHQGDVDDIIPPSKVKLNNMWSGFISGAGLFSDGYVNNSISTVTTCLSILYPKEYADSSAISNVSSIAFAGTVFGMLLFGYISDHVHRKGGMMAANVLLIVFTILCAVATWGKTPYGLFTAITVFRFFLGVGIGAEYPTASVICSEFSNQLPLGHRNRYFVWFTNFMIDFGFVVSSFVPLVCLWIFRENHLNPVWRVTLGLGVICPFLLFFARMHLVNSKSYDKFNMKKSKKVPYLLIIKFYWLRLTVVSIIWFIYDFSAYSFGIYSSFIFNQIIPDGDIYKTFGWNVVFNLFYLPGAFLGALAADYFGPRLTIGVGLLLQGTVGFIMSGTYSHLKNHIGAFVVVYGIFSTLGEFGPGDNIGLLASKTSATPIRGEYYGIAAAVGKVGAFVGTYVFPIIIRNNGGKGTDSGMRAPYQVSSALCFFAAFLAIFMCPSIGQDAINKEDLEFVEYLKLNGYDISQMGSEEYNHSNLVGTTRSNTGGYKDKAEESVAVEEVSSREL